MRNRVKEAFPNLPIVAHDSHVHIADYTEQTRYESIKRGVEIFYQKPNDIECFFLKNDKSVSFSSVIFDNDSFIDQTTGKALTQCECICFSAAEYSHGKGPWVLLLELKYCGKYSDYLSDNMDKAIQQISETYQYFRDKGVIENKQQCNWVVSFPKIEHPFTHSFATQDEVANLKSKGVVFRGLNELTIKNKYKLGTCVAV